MKHVRQQAFHPGLRSAFRLPIVKASGLRWLSLTLLTSIPWAGRIWAPPFLTALAPLERCCQTRGRRHKMLTDWGRQIVLQARRWLPGRELVVVADSRFAALEFLAAVNRRGAACITRLHLDAALYDPAPVRAAAPARHKGMPPASQASAWPPRPRCRPTRPRGGCASRCRAGTAASAPSRSAPAPPSSATAGCWSSRSAFRPLRGRSLRGIAFSDGARVRSPGPLRPASPALHRPGMPPRSWHGSSNAGSWR